MKKHCSSLTVMSFLMMLLGCSDRDSTISTSSLPHVAELRTAAMTDNFVSSELVPASDDESDPIALGRVTSALTALKVFKIVKKAQHVESSTQVDRVNDTSLVVTVNRGTSGTLMIHASYNQDAAEPDTVIYKPLTESFSRKVLFFLKQHSEDGDDDEFEVTGTVAELSKDCATSSGSFSLVHNGISTLILITSATKFDDITCDALENGNRVEVEAEEQVTSLGGQQAWIAKEIEVEHGDGDDDSDRNFHSDFKKAAISLLEGGTEVKNARITEMRIFFSNSDSVVIQSPLEFYFFYKEKHKYMVHVLNASAPIRIQVLVESSLQNPEIVVLRCGSLERGKVSLKRQLQLVEEQNAGSLTLRTYEASLPGHGIGGYFHSFVEVWAYDSIYDDNVGVSTHSWSIPYVVR